MWLLVCSDAHLALFWLGFALAAKRARHHIVTFHTKSDSRARVVVTLALPSAVRATLAVASALARASVVVAFGLRQPLPAIET